MAMVSSGLLVVLLVAVALVHSRVSQMVRVAGIAPTSLRSGGRWLHKKGGGIGRRLTSVGQHVLIASDLPTPAKIEASPEYFR